MKIQTPNLTLLPHGPKYLSSTHKYATDTENTRYMFHLPNASLEETQAFLTNAEKEWQKAEPSFYEFAVLFNGRHIGAVCVYFDDEGSGEVGWIIDKDYWGRGFATEAAGGMIQYFRSELGVRRFIAHCDSENIASQRVMTKLGFKLIDEYGGRKNRASDEERMERMYALELQ